MTLHAAGPLDLLRHKVATMLSVPIERVDFDLDRELLAPDGYEVAGHLIDSLTLVDLVTTLEDEYGVSMQRLLDGEAPLTLRAVVEEVAASSPRRGPSVGR